MSNPTPQVQIPRPGTFNNQGTIPGTSEDSFTAYFGSLLPPAQFIASSYGDTALYEFPPTSSPSSPASARQRILLIHGLGTPALGLLPLARAIILANPSAHLALYDLWGHGLSSTPLVPHTPGLFHYQVLLILAKLGWSSAHLIGFSYGGSTVATFTALHKECVQSVTLLAPAGLLRLPDFTNEQQEFIVGGEEVNEEEAREWMFDFTGALVIEEGWKARFATGDIFSGNPIQKWQRKHHVGHIPSFMAIFRGGGLSDQQELFAVVGRSEVPKLAVIGELDDLCTEKDLREAGFGDVVVVEGGTHNLVRDRVDEVAAPINKFLESLRRA